VTINIGTAAALYGHCLRGRQAHGRLPPLRRTGGGPPHARRSGRRLADTPRTHPGMCGCGLRRDPGNRPFAPGIPAKTPLTP
jgi:hypothetical protein